MSNNYLYRLADSCGMTLTCNSSGMITGSKNIRADHILDGLELYQTVVSSVVTEKLVGVIVKIEDLNVGLFVGLSTQSTAYMVVTSLTKSEAHNFLEKHPIKEWSDVQRALQSKAVAFYANQQGKWVIPSKS